MHTLSLQELVYDCLFLRHVKRTRIRLHLQQYVDSLIHHVILCLDLGHAWIVHVRIGIAHTRWRSAIAHVRVGSGWETHWLWVPGVVCSWWLVVGSRIIAHMLSIHRSGVVLVGNIRVVHAHVFVSTWVVASVPCWHGYIHGRWVRTYLWGMMVHWSSLRSTNIFICIWRRITIHA